MIYYIAGSIMRGYLKVGRRFPNSATWKSIVAVLRAKVLIERPDGDLDVDAEWTMDVDRGSLLFINAKCQNVFVKLTKVIFSCEKQDGSIDYETVISKVCNSDVSVDWDDIVSDSLPQDVSLNLMSDIVVCFCRTCGRGFAKRRLNFLRNRTIASLTTRHLVASRKNR